MRKVNDYQEGMRDALEPFSEKLNSIANSIGDSNEILDDIIDCIEWNYDNPEELVNLLKAKRLKGAKPRQFRISIVYKGKDNEPLADALRKDLNAQKNSCDTVEYITFKKRAGSLVDHRVYIGNPERISVESCQVLYKAYGMLILQSNGDYIAEYDSKYNFTEDDKGKFISYYESVISKSLQKSKAAEKALKSRKKRKLRNPEGSDPKGTFFAMDALTQGLDFWDDKPLWMTLALGLPSMLVSLVAMICLVPVGIGEFALRETVENLREANFDNKFVADAQRQILEVKLVDLFMQEQMHDLNIGNHTETNKSEKPSSQQNANTSAQHTMNTNVQDKGESYVGTRNLIGDEIKSIIKETQRKAPPHPKQIKIEGKVIEGTPTLGSNCMLFGQDDIYKIVRIGRDGGLAQSFTGHTTDFTLEKI